MLSVCVFVDWTTKALKLTIKFSLGGINWTAERVYWIEYQRLRRRHLREKLREGRKLSRNKQVNHVFSKQTECDAREKGQQREGTRRKKPLPTEPKGVLTDLHHLCFLLSLFLFFSIHPFFSCLSTSSHLHLTSMTGWFKVIWTLFLNTNEKKKCFNQPENTLGYFV